MNRGVGVSQKRKIVTDNFFKVWHNKKRWFFIMIKIPKKRKKNKVIFRHLYKMIQNDDKKAPKKTPKHLFVKNVTLNHLNKTSILDIQ